MKRFLICLPLLLGCVASRAQFRADYESLYDSDAVAAMKEQVAFLSSAALEGRKAGSEGEFEAAAYVSETFASSMKASASVTGICVNSWMLFPNTVTASAMSFRRFPSQSGQAVSDMHSSISLRMLGLCVSA